MIEKVRQSTAPVTGNDGIDIDRLVATVMGARWWVLGIITAPISCAAVYTLLATPIYSAGALVQTGQNIGNSLVQNIGSASSDKSPTSEAEIQFIQSRLALGKAVSGLNLDIAVTKDTFPTFDADWDRLTGRQNETVNVITFTLPKTMNGQTFTFNMLNDTSY